MKSITIPYIGHLAAMDYAALRQNMEQHGVRNGIDCANWSAFPYRPIVSFSAAHDASHLFVNFFVRGDGVVALCGEDNAGKTVVWSCS